MKKKLKLLIYVFLWFLTPLWWLLYKMYNWFTPSYSKIGVYAIIAPPGKGKSLLITKLQDNARKKGDLVITNTPSIFHNVTQVDYLQLFKNNRAYFNFNGSRITDMYYDEPQLDFDNRNHSNDSYKNSWSPFAKFLSVFRHVKIKRVFFSSQAWMRLDSKVRDLVDKVLVPECIYKVDIKALVEERKIKIIPKAIKVTIYDKRDYEDNLKYLEMVKKGLFETKIKVEQLDIVKVPISRKILDSHNTYAFENTYKDLPIFNEENYQIHLLKNKKINA